MKKNPPPPSFSKTSPSKIQFRITGRINYSNGQVLRAWRWREEGDDVLLVKDRLNPPSLQAFPPSPPLYPAEYSLFINMLMPRGRAARMQSGRISSGNRFNLPQLVRGNDRPTDTTPLSPSIRTSHLSLFSAARL